MDNHVSRSQKNLWISCFILAPLFISLAQFFWHDGMVSMTAGVLQVIAFTCWIFAFQGMFHVLRQEMPKYAVYGFAVAVYACIGGNNFGVDGIYGEAIGLNNLTEAGELLNKIGWPTAFYLFIPGGLFPLSLLWLGVQLWRNKKVSTLTGILLCLGAICFPLSRIPRIPLLAHLDNIILLTAHILVAVELFGKPQWIRNRSTWKPQYES